MVSILGFSQFTPLPQLPLKMMLGLKVVKIDGKVIDLECGVLECRKHIARNFFLE